MQEDQPNFKVTDRRLFNADGSPRDLPPEEKSEPKIVAAQEAAAPAPAPEAAIPETEFPPDVVEAARVRAIIIPSVRVSYFGTPAGTIGGNYIPFERFFRDDVVLFGLPTSTYFSGNIFYRTK